MENARLINFARIKANINIYDESRIVGFLGAALSVFPPVLHTMSMELFKIDAVKNEKGTYYARRLKEKEEELWIPVSDLRPIVRCNSWLLQVHTGIPIDMRSDTALVPTSLNVKDLAEKIAKMSINLVDIIRLKDDGLGLSVNEISESSVRSSLVRTSCDYCIFKLDQSKIEWI